MASRIRYHYNGNAEGSTLRLALGCLLRDELGLDLRRVDKQFYPSREHLRWHHAQVFQGEM